MKQVLESLRDGVISVADVPMPSLRPGFVLVRNEYSLISSGTEGGTVKLGQMNLLQKALARPEQAMKVVQVARTQGPWTAWQVAQRALDMPIALGYSSAGRVLAVGAGVDGFSVGDRVACAGQGYASHAEAVLVPKHLCALIPEGVSARDAAFSTIGAIALQSLRVAEVSLGESVAVIGLGLVGATVAQLLRAAGCRVLGIDVDARRCDFVAERGWAQTAVIGRDEIQTTALAFARGAGVDAVIVTATSDDAAPVSLAGELCRRKGRVIVVGRTLISGPRETFLFKELELRTSMAYGPGTGDPAYELEGHDYPIGYVRWTEQRNLVAFLDQIAARSVDVGALLTHEYPVAEVAQAFARVLHGGDETVYGVAIHYPETAGEPQPARIPLAAAATTTTTGRLRVGVIGAGSFAGNELLPLVARCGVRLRGIASATGVRARALGDKYAFEYCAASADEIVDDPETDAVLILTRHDTHAALAARALATGKHVFVEKPLALTHAELDQVEQAWQASGRGLMVGFNRRFAPLAQQLRASFGQRSQPLSISYRINVGYRPPEHWLHHPAEGGGVLLGEACHQIDFCSWLCGAPIVAIRARPLGGSGAGYLRCDNFHLSLELEDGSLATVVYASNGSKAFPTEVCDVSGLNRSAQLTDFRALSWSAGARVRSTRRWLSSDKGHQAQMRHFFDMVCRQGDSLQARSYLHSSRQAVFAHEQLQQVLGDAASTP